MATPDFLCGFWDLNPGPHAFVAGTLPTGRFLSLLNPACLHLGFLALALECGLIGLQCPLRHIGSHTCARQPSSQEALLPNMHACEQMKYKKTSVLPYSIQQLG